VRTVFFALTIALSSWTPALAQTVVLTSSPEGLTAEYRLSAKTQRMAFSQLETIRTDWSVVTPDVSLTPGEIVSTAEIDRVTLQLQPDSTEDGRGYIALTRLGEGYVLYAPALTLEGQTLRLEADLPESWTLAPDGPFDGYVYLGPTSAIERRGTGVIHIASATPRPVATTTLFETFDTAFDYFTQTFGPLPRPPVMSVTQQGAGPVPFRGDVTDSGMSSIRFHGDIGDALDAEALAEVEHFAWHEMTHLWNSHLARPIEGSPWLHEGGAEYLALVGSTSVGRIDQADALAGLSQNLTDCRNAVASRPDIMARISTGAAVYSCGTIIQWLADMELRLGNEPRGIVAVWADFIDRARRGEAAYGPDDLRAKLGGSSAVFSLLEGPAESRWSDLETALARLNVRWVNQPSNTTLVTATLRHIKRQVCTGGLSYSLRNGAVEMESGTDCGPFAGTVTLASVEGHDPLANSAVMFEAVQQRCERRGSLTVMVRGSATPIAITCAADLAMPTAYSLMEAPLIALPTTMAP